MTATIRAVFSNRAYIALACAVAALFWFIFNIFDGLLFVWPYLDFYLPSDAIANFVISNVTAAVMGMVGSINLYLYRHSRLRSGRRSMLSGSSLGVTSSMCVGCSYVGFYLATIFGNAGVALSSFLSNYQVPIRLVALGLLVWGIYSASKRITKSCQIE